MANLYVALTREPDLGIVQQLQATLDQFGTIRLRDEHDRIMGTISAERFASFSLWERVAFAKASYYHCQAIQDKYPIGRYPT